MSLTNRIEKLTPEQEALIPVFREKWRAIALSTSLLDRTLATAGIQTAYKLIKKAEPVVLFCDSPQAVPKTFTSILKRRLDSDTEWLVESYPENQRLAQLRKELGVPVGMQLEEQLHRPLRKQLEQQLHWQVRMELEGQLRQQPREPQLWEQLHLNQQLRGHLPDCLRLESWIFDGVWLDFAISVLNRQHDKSKWLAFKSLVEHCGWLFPYEKICLVCDRPIHLAFDNQARLHAEGEPAIQFLDGFSVYAYQGAHLPERYGKIHPHQWRPQWLLEETNAELRRVLIQGIGYERIFHELEATELDSWAEYTLLEINADVDEEPILLLKMTCPSTGFIHVSRVPPEVESAKEAIRWVNWEIDPEEFAVQT